MMCFFLSLFLLENRQASQVEGSQERIGSHSSPEESTWAKIGLFSSGSEKLLTVRGDLRVTFRYQIKNLSWNFLEPSTGTVPVYLVPDVK